MFGPETPPRDDGRQGGGYRRADLFVRVPIRLGPTPMTASVRDRNREGVAVRSPLSSHGNPVVASCDQPGDGERRTRRGGPTTWAPPSTRRAPAARALRRPSAVLPGVSHGRGHPRPAPPPFLRCLVPHRAHAGGPQRVIPASMRVADIRTAVKDLAEEHVDCPRVRAAGQREHQTPGDPYGRCFDSSQCSAANCLSALLSSVSRAPGRRERSLINTAAPQRY